MSYSDPSSSYVKIYGRLLNTKTGKDQIEKIRRNLTTVHVVKWTFSVSGDTQFRMTTSWTIVTVDGYKFSPSPNGDISNVGYKLKSLFNIKEVLENHFGRDKDVKTMNCQRDIILGHGSSKRNRRSFYDWFEYALEPIFANEIKSFYENVKASLASAEQSEEYKSDKTRFIAERAVSDIKTVLMRYQFLGDEFLNNSIKEFVAHSILES